MKKIAFILMILFSIGHLFAQGNNISKKKVYIPNAFSPNQDGVNDFFQLSTTADIKVQIIKYLIFDRWSELVYTAKDFPISSSEFWWDGTSKRMAVSSGAFAYYIEVEYGDGEKEIFKGSVTLIR